MPLTLGQMLHGLGRTLERDAFVLEGGCESESEEKERLGRMLQEMDAASISLRKAYELLPYPCGTMVSETFINHQHKDPYNLRRSDVPDHLNCTILLTSLDRDVLKSGGGPFSSKVPLWRRKPGDSGFDSSVPLWRRILDHVKTGAVWGIYFDDPATLLGPNGVASLVFVEPEAAARFVAKFGSPGITIDGKHINVQYDPLGMYKIHREFGQSRSLQVSFLPAKLEGQKFYMEDHIDNEFQERGYNVDHYLIEDLSNDELVVYRVDFSCVAGRADAFRWGIRHAEGCTELGMKAEFVKDPCQEAYEKEQGQEGQTPESM